MTDHDDPHFIADVCICVCGRCMRDTIYGLLCVCADCNRKACTMHEDTT